MKYIFTPLLICINLLVNSQMYTEFNGKGSMLNRDGGGVDSFTYGFEARTGYSFFNQKVDVDFFFMFQKEYDLAKFNFYGIEVLYKHFGWKYFKPYIGMNVSRYKLYYGDRVLGGMLIPDTPEFGYNISPKVGVLFKSDLVDGLFINLGYNYRFLNREFGQDMTFNSLSIGLKYYFNFMKKKRKE